MQDIRKPHTRSRSDDISSRTEQFEKHNYSRAGKDGRDLDNNEVTDSQSSRLHRRITDDVEVYPHRRKEDFVYRDSRTRYIRDRRNVGTHIFVAVVVIVVLFVGLYTYVFDSATITFVPKNQDVPVSKIVTFDSDRSDMTAVYYELATSTITKSKTLPLSETKKVESKASGKIVVYNNYDSNPQKLIKNTRFESPEGKIFRIEESVVVPGKKGDTPGSIEVTVTADSYGADYNLAPTDFTIPGFKDTPRYTGFFARSNGGMSGGASGDTALVSDSDLNSAKDELTLELTKSVKDSLSQVNRDGYLGLYDNVQVAFSSNEQDVKTGNTSTYSLTATGYLTQVDKSSLAHSVALDIRDYTNEEVKLINENSLHFSLKDTTNVVKDTKFDVLIEGTPRVVWVNDIESIKKLLLGKKTEELSSVLKGVPFIDKAEASFSPIWISTFPNKEESIKFIENIPNN